MSIDHSIDILEPAQINELAAALAKAQGAMQNATMNRVNPHFKSRYADLASMIDAIRASLSANGLAVSQVIGIRDGGMILRTILMHTSGQSLTSEYPLPTAARPQEIGSALTYARRYSLAALVCNSADEDDDGNAAQSKSNGDAKDVSASAPISAEQLEIIQRLMIEVGADIPKFCEYFKLNIVADLQVKDFERAKAALEKKRQPNPYGQALQSAMLMSNATVVK